MNRTKICSRSERIDGHEKDGAMCLAVLFGLIDSVVVWRRVLGSDVDVKGTPLS